MAILVDAGTRVIGQGITGRQGTFHASSPSPTAPGSSRA